MATVDTNPLDPNGSNTGLENPLAANGGESARDYLEEYYSRAGSMGYGPRGEREITEDFLRRTLDSELLKAQQIYDNYIAYGSINADDYTTDEHGNVIIGDNKAASGDHLGFSFSDEQNAKNIFGDNWEAVQQTMYDYNSQIYAISSGAAQRGLTLPEEIRADLRAEAYAMYPDASEAELQYVFEELVKRELGVEDWTAQKYALSDERDAALEQYGLRVATGAETGPNSIAGTYEYVDDSGQTYTLNASSGELTRYKAPIKGQVFKAAWGMAVSFMAGPALASTFQGLGMSASVAKAASTAVINIAKDYMMTGDVNWEDALLSAALSYGGAELSDALQGSGVLGEIGSQITEFGDNLMENGGDILSAALQAGGMSLVTQMVKEGEIDWKDAAMAAVMAGGTVALTDFISSIGKDQAVAEKELSEWDEFDEWQQEAMNADIKDPFLNPNYKTVGDGLVMNINTNEVFGVTDNKSYGNFADLDKNGDGQLSGSDLQDINVTHEHVSTTPNLPPSNYNEYAENAGGVGRQYYVDENGNVHSGPSIAPDGDGGYYNKIDGTKLKPLTGVYDEKEGLYLFEDENGNIVSVADRSGRIVASYDPETKTWLDANGEFNEDYHNFLDGKYTGSGNISSVENPFSISKEQYDAFSGEQLLDDMWVQKGREGLMNLTDGEMEALIAKFGTGAELEAYLQANGIGVHYSPQSGWVLEAGVDTSDGIYGMNHDGGYIADIEGNPSGISTNFTDPNGTVSNSTTENPFNKEPPKDPNTNSNNSASGADNNDNATGQNNASTDAGTAGGGATDSTGGNGASGATGGDASTGGDQNSTGDLGGGSSGGSGTDSGASAGGGAIGGGSSGLPDFSGMTPSEIAAWWAANGFGNPGGGMLGGDTGGNTQGTETGSGTDSSTGTNTGSTDTNSGTGQTPGGGTGDGSTGGDNTGGGDTSGSTDGGDTGAGTGGGGNSTDTEGGGGSGGDNSGTGDGNGDGSGSGTGTGGSGSGSGSGDSGSNSGAGDGTSGGAGSGGGTDGSSGGGSGGSSGGGTGGNSGGTGGGAGGGGEGGGGVGTGLGAGMLGGLGAGSGDNSNPQWGQLFPMKQFVARAKPQTNQQKRASLFADLLKGLG
jgi:hypothetical protein